MNAALMPPFRRFNSASKAARLTCNAVRAQPARFDEALDILDQADLPELTGIMEREALPIGKINTEPRMLSPGILFTHDRIAGHSEM